MKARESYPSFLERLRIRKGQDVFPKPLTVRWTPSHLGKGVPSAPSGTPAQLSGRTARPRPDAQGWIAAEVLQ